MRLQITYNRYKDDLLSNNSQRMICNKTQPNKYQVDFSFEKSSLYLNSKFLLKKRDGKLWIYTLSNNTKSIHYNYSLLSNLR